MQLNIMIMGSDIQFFIEMYAKLFAASSPLAAAAMFIAITPSYTPKQRWKTAVRAINVSFGILLLCAFFGIGLLEIMGVNMDAFRIAGGVVMSLIGIDMIRSEASTDNSVETSPMQQDITVTPLAFPIISGPGAISSLMIGKSEACNSTQTLYAYLGLLAIMATFYGLFYIVSFSSKWLKPALVQISAKLCGLVLLAMAAQFFVSGILGFLK